MQRVALGLFSNKKKVQKYFFSKFAKNFARANDNEKTSAPYPYYITRYTRKFTKSRIGHERRWRSRTCTHWCDKSP